jgi:cold shock CspA family protein
MDKPLEITFRNMDRSESLTAVVEEKCKQLEQFYHHIIGMHVIVEAPNRHPRRGNLYHVMIEAHVPGKRLVTDHSPGREIRHKEAVPTINDAFRAMSRQLEDYARRQRGDTKHHEMPLQGHVTKIFPYEGYGFITATDGQEIYFHKNSVIHHEFDNLEQGMPVRLVLAEGESLQGPQASTVEVILHGMKVIDETGALPQTAKKSGL